MKSKTFGGHFVHFGGDLSTTYKENIEMAFLSKIILLVIVAMSAKSLNRCSDLVFVIFCIILFICISHSTGVQI